MNESETGHGAVYLSDAFSYVDRGYGGYDSALLLDMRGAGNLLSAQRRVLCRYYAAAGKTKGDVRKRVSYIPLWYILMSN